MTCLLLGGCMPWNFIREILWGLGRNCIAPGWIVFASASHLGYLHKPKWLLRQIYFSELGESTREKNRTCFFTFREDEKVAYSLWTTIPELSHMITYSYKVGCKMQLLAWWLCAQIKFLCNMVTHILVNNITHIWTKVSMIWKPCPFHFIMLPSWKKANRKLFFHKPLRTLMSPSK